MYEQAHPKRIFGKAVLVTILAAGAFVALCPVSADHTPDTSVHMIQVTELA